jgi:ubiquitin-like modifier-activating enzyme ATG7
LKIAPTTIDLKSQLDHNHLEREAANLNLRLMRWRVAPGLDLEGLGEVKCLLLGAGTLGCYLSRILVGWGVRNITFLDSGRVAASNPVRQCLYTRQDGREGNWKASVAAERLTEICGDVNARGVKACIPMPGHTMGDKEVEDARTVEEEIKRADVVFMLTDSRESRWMPTVVGRREGKTVINIALGFSSWLVCRHGSTSDSLGCYFCTDVVAPSNSEGDRTLDQQCTVTRPGLAGIAAGMGAEVMVAGLFGGGGAMGQPPHTIRGDLGGWSLRCFSCERVGYCTGCGDSVVRRWEEGGVEFMREVAEDGTGELLEEISGLKDVKRKVDEGGWGGDDDEEDDW